MLIIILLTTLSWEWTYHWAGSKLITVDILLNQIKFTCSFLHLSVCNFCLLVKQLYNSLSWSIGHLVPALRRTVCPRRLSFSQFVVLMNTTNCEKDSLLGQMVFPTEPLTIFQIPRFFYIPYTSCGPPPPVRSGSLYTPAGSREWL